MNPSNPLASLAAEFHLSEIYAFGSRAREIQSWNKGTSPPKRLPASDVDIAVEPVPGRALSPRDKVRLTTALEDLLQVSRVDLVVLSEAPPFLSLDIVKGELLYCRDKDSQAEHELEILRRAGDLAFYERQRRELALAPGVQQAG